MRVLDTIRGAAIRLDGTEHDYDPIAIDANQYRFVYRDLCCLPHRSHLQYRDERIQRPNVPTTEPKSVLSL